MAKSVTWISINSIMFLLLLLCLLIKENIFVNAYHTNDPENKRGNDIINNEYYVDSLLSN